jgi:60 kDa SS-A/Ro ribonucleoprotein
LKFLTSIFAVSQPDFSCREAPYLLLNSRTKEKNMNHYVNTIAPSKGGKKAITPQTSPIPGREAEMSQNNAGGFTFTLDMWGYLDRFLILGSDKPTYYASAQKLTKDAAKNVSECIKTDGLRAVARIVEISDSGRAPKNDPAVFALALCAVEGNAETVAAAYAALPLVCRIGTHLFQFVAALDAMGKWNAAAKRGVAAWYTAKHDDRLAVQLLKYAQRDGWSHRDVLRLAHVKPTSDRQDAMFHFVAKEGAHKDGKTLPPLFEAVEQLKKVDAKTAVKLIEANKDITWEMMPTELQRQREVWEALLPNMGLTAMIRKLGQLTDIGLIAPLSAGSMMVIEKLSNADAIKKARVHPAVLLNAFKQYGKGHGDKGSLSWKPDQRVLDALNDSFYESFNFVPSTGEGYLFGIDISGSMTGGSCAGLSNLAPYEGAAVMAMAIARREKNYFMGGFSNTFKELKITPSMRLDTALRAVQGPFGSTDCSLPMIYARQQRMKGVDKFVVITDNETYGGHIQPVQALRDYRSAYGRNAKLIVMAMTATPFTIADPKDPGMLDVVGFDASAPQIVQQF